MSRYFRLPVLMILLSIFAGLSPAFAADKKADADAKAEKAEKDKGAELITLWQDKTNDLLNGMSDNQRKQFEYIIATNGVIKSVENVLETLHEGADSCSKAHDDMSAEMKDAYTGFNQNLLDPMKNAKLRLEKMVRHQSISSRNEMRNYLTLTNRAAVAKEDEVEFIPVTRKEDCEKLLATLKSDKSDKLAKYLNESYGLDQNLRPVDKGEKK